MTAQQRSQNVLVGSSLIVVGALTISIQDVVFKLFSSTLTLWQIFALRGILTVVLLVVLGMVLGRATSVLKSAMGGWAVLRGLCLTMTFLAFYAAIPFISLSTVGAANYIAPIFIAILSATVIKERVSLWGWIGVILGFVGVITLLQPGTDAFSPFALLPVAGAAFYAIGHTITRTKCQCVPVEALTLSLAFTMMMAGSVISGILVVLHPAGAMVDQFPYLFGQWSGVSASDWYVLLVLAVFTIVIGLMLARAYQIAPPAIVGTFEYSYLAFAAAWDILFFDTVPATTTLIGMVLIVGAGLMVMQGRPKDT